MSRELSSRWLMPLARPVARAVRDFRYRLDLRRGRAAGDYRHSWSPWQPPGAWAVEVRLPAAAATPEVAIDWCRRQSLRELRLSAYGPGGRRRWQVDREGLREGGEPVAILAFYAPLRLADLDPVHLEASALILAAENVDAVLLQPENAEDAAPRDAAEIVDAAPRSLALFREGAYRYDATAASVRPAAGERLVKAVGPAGVAALPRSPATSGRRRRGPYLASADLGGRLDVAIRDAALLARSPAPAGKPAILVLTSFLARGGAEHTLFETLRALGERFDFAIATLAPHRPELGDRRADFREITPRIYSLGDWVHPAAMPGILGSLLDATGAGIVYNANGTTLFYDFAPRLKAARPALRIVDHLYDHRVGYVERYGPELLASVDACVAENRRIAEVLVEERGWPADRVPVIHPCGRRRSAFPAGDDARETRRRLRRELKIGPSDLVILTAARMHPQKRPLDLVELARRVRDLDDVRFLIAGGGELEDDVDAAIAASGARIARLPFRTDVPELIVAADAGCLVSDYEGLPVFLLECLQAGRPFLGTDAGELGEVLRATGAGLVVERPGDLDALETAVRRLADPAIRRRLAERAREAGRGFDVETCAEKYAAAWSGG